MEEEVRRSVGGAHQVGGFASGGRPWLHIPTEEEPNESGNNSADHEDMTDCTKIEDEISRVTHRSVGGFQQAWI